MKFVNLTGKLIVLQRIDKDPLVIKSEKKEATACVINNCLGDIDGVLIYDNPFLEAIVNVPSNPKKDIAYIVDKDVAKWCVGRKDVFYPGRSVEGITCYLIQAPK